jgi:hypothetical protein
MNTIKTVMHAYCFDTAKREDAEAYKELRERLRAQGLDCFETWGGRGSYYDSRFVGGVEVELETKHVFSNQWNTAPIAGISESGLRVFDWAQDYPINFRTAIKRGHYLVQVPEMAAVRRDTLACGYCGKHEPAASGAEFCDKCLDSAFLKESELHLLRLLPAGVRLPKRDELTPEERERLMPLYVQAQTHGRARRNAQQAEARRKRVAKDYAEHVAKAQRAIERAAAERDGFLWLLDRGMNTENVIFYNHTGKFSFGWRSPITGATREALLAALAEFPYPYDVETKRRY